MFYSKNGDTKKELNLALESIRKKTFRVKTNHKNNWFVNFRGTLSLIKRIFRKKKSSAFIKENDFKTWIF
jgi:hypothetical protein